MRLTRRSSRCLLSTMVVGVLLLGLSLTGCAPEKKKSEPKKSPAAQSAKKAEEPKKTEEPATPATKPEVKHEEPAKTEKPATTGPKLEMKAEAPAKKAEEPAKKPEEPAKKAEAPAKKAEEPAKKAEEPAKKGDAAGMPAAPKVSTFAPAEDLATQTDKFIGDLAKATAAEAEYKDQPEGKITRDANTLILVALALGLSDQDNKYKANAGAMIEAAQKLAAAKDFDAAKKGVEGLQAAAKTGGKSSVELKWAKLASLSELMKQVPLVNTKLKGNIRKFSTKAKDAAGNTAVLAVIAQGAMANVSDTKKPEEAAKWFEFSIQMRDATASANAAIHANDEKATNAAMDKMQKACDDCHAVFHKEEKK